MTGSGKSLYITPTIPNRVRDGQAIMEVIIWGMWGINRKGVSIGVCALIFPLKLESLIYVSRAF